jgi:hypothetical protein
MSGKRTLKSSRLSRFTSVLTMSRRYIRSAVRGGLKSAVYRLSLSIAVIISFSALSISSQTINSFTGGAPSNKSRTAISLTELVPKQYSDKYDRWKRMLVSVESGRRLWSRFAENPAFRLTIMVTKKQEQGAKVDDYIWEKGRLVGATVTLGGQLDYGFPSTMKYPVLGSLAAVRNNDGMRGDDVLAAAKFAHELGHIEHAAIEATNFQLQNELAPIYVERFLSNGHDLSDPELEELAERMGGAPVDIKNERENRAEVYTLRFLLDKLENKKERKFLKAVQKYLQPEFKYLFSPVINGAEYPSLARPRIR